ncbi:hypothetical protein [uncultured Demequina sp.]|uniref:hypothetical protein n=1 Tax=uncultured Demequina sp. TaxID=693499 RepID=UPI0025F664CC|nr:hypothetical protein [uncultured Demequina sp.]
MLHPELAALLRRRLDVIADHPFRDRDPTAHLEALKSVSLDIETWHAARRGTLPARLEHFLSGCSYDKALRFLEADGASPDH